MATLSATTAASLLVGLMAVAARPGERSTTPDRAPRGHEHGPHDPMRRSPAPPPPRLSR